MPRVLLAVDPPRAERLATELEHEGVDVVGVVEASRPAAGWPSGTSADALVLEVRSSTLPPELVAQCRARGIRLVPLCADATARGLAASAGIGPPQPLDVEGWVLAEALAVPALPPREEPVTTTAGRTVVVWGPHGSPGRTSVAIELAAELSRGGRHVALVDADAHAPSVALALGLADEGPGFAAACRQAERGGLDGPELSRISASVPVAGSSIDVLTGINRPGRWPELGEARVSAALAACRAWAEHVVVDVAAPLERDEEIVSDLEGPRRNGATLAALRSADVVVAVCAADPVGVARFVRAFTELRAAIGSTRVVVVVNRLRAGTMGIDARGQVRRTLERFADIEQVWFLPWDTRAADAALLAARPVADVSPRSPLAAAMRRLVGEALVPIGPPARRRAAQPRARRRA